MISSCSTEFTFLLFFLEPTYTSSVLLLIFLQIKFYNQFISQKKQLLSS